MNAYLTQDRIESRRAFDHQAEIEREKWVDDRAKEIIALFPENPTQLVTFSIPAANKPYAG
ncbi:host nuclease inhibitor GamL [Salmonella enterica]|uniref:host nuclease inhibitor GamL n=2 Tax=Enterobacteriaceae TaxID=543 RepID=UPI002079313A|nr:host nuclease inhibitor GamL [Salmonella enterica]USL74608.1 host nuclease inhibitor GamL [Salmonella enterica subsp. enterica serovar Indiana]